jgi:hypothetical protein
MPQSFSFLLRSLLTYVLGAQPDACMLSASPKAVFYDSLVKIGRIRYEHGCSCLPYEFRHPEICICSTRALAHGLNTCESKNKMIRKNHDNCGQHKMTSSETLNGDEAHLFVLVTLSHGRFHLSVKN